MKNYIKKLIVAIIFVVFLIIFFLLGKNISDSRKKNDISLIKSIINEKYDSVNYINNSKYIYAYTKTKNLNKYSIFDLSGNKLYTITDNKELNITAVTKNYIITKDSEYHLFDTDYIEITSGKKIEAINNYLVKVDNKIINLDNEIVFNDVYYLTTYNDNKILNINNYYLTDRKGKVLLNNTIVKEEIKSNSITDYLIIEKENKYYTFFVKVEMVIGDSFDSYINKKNLYVKNNDEIYKVYKTGLRKKIYSFYIDKKYNLEEKNYIKKDKVFVTKNNSFGILDINENKYKKIKNNKPLRIKDLDNDNSLLIYSNKSIIYDKTKSKVIYKTKEKIDDIIIFDNKYKTIKKGNNYILLDDKDTIITNDKKQIIINKQLIKVGSLKDEIIIFDLNTNDKEDAKYITIYNKKYYKIKNTIISIDFKEKYKSDDFISYYKNTITYKEKNNLIFNNIKNNKRYIYELKENDKIYKDINLNKIVVIKRNNKYIFIDLKGDVIKSIKDRKIVNCFDVSNNKILFITEREKGNKKYIGSYLAE